VGLVWGNPFVATTRALSKKLLALSVIGLGAGMDLRVVARAGLHGIGSTVVTITACLALGALLARVLRVGGTTALLIAVGTAICGGSAIAAVSPVARAKEHEVTVALATVFLLNAVALLVFPLIGHVAGLDQDRFGLWAALAIHDTSSVVGAAMTFGPRALEVATVVKLTRALWIVPVTLGVGFFVARRPTLAATKQGPVARPWFIAGFLAAAALATAFPSLAPLGHRVSNGARHAMAATLFLIGAGLTRPALRAVGVRPLLMGVALWVAMAGLSLGGIVMGVLG
jgi:uncharacterized integral membrane protein (TIGR00698 family)